jgi:hypothetical protein
MTGPGHYKQAERLIERAQAEAAGAGTGTCWAFAESIAVAQVHATLALAAAVAFSADMTAGEWPGWRDAAASEETKGDAL